MAAQPSAIPLINASLGGSPRPDPRVPPATSSIDDELASYIRARFSDARDHRNYSGLSDQMLRSLRAMRGEYDPEMDAELRKLEMSRTYARVAANKVRVVAAALREVYTSVDRPWAITPSPVPDMPNQPDLQALVEQQLQAEVAELRAAQMQQAVLAQQTGQMPPPTPPVTPAILAARRIQIQDQIQQHLQKQAQDAARERENTLDDVLTEGGFYEALWEFLLDLPTYPFAVLKGPVVYNRPKLQWQGGKAVTVSEPTMCWERVSPFDLYWAPWASKIQDGYLIQRTPTTRAALQSLIGLPSYNEEAIRYILATGPSAMKEWEDYIDCDRAWLEQREDDDARWQGAVDGPCWMLEYHGPVSGQMLIDWGMDESLVPDPTKDLDVTAWLVNDRVIGVRLNPHPLGAKPFYVDSYERIPGSVAGMGIPLMIEDVCSVANAAIRSLINNMAFASGPQIGLNEDRLGADQTDIEIRPFRVWTFNNEQLGSNQNQPPINFWQPQSNASEFLGIYQAAVQMADDLSGIPRFLQGEAAGISTIGRTSSGISMLLQQANRTIKQVITSVDYNVVQKAVEDLNVYLSILRPDLIQDGDINIVARGASELVQRDQQRMRQMEFLQATGNPVDMQLVGLAGRKAILSELARGTGLPVDTVITGGTGGLQNAQQMAAQGQSAQAPGMPNQQPQGAGGQPGPEPQNVTGQQAPAQPQPQQSAGP